VNAWDPDCAVVVSISLDHVDYLGADLEGIGREKAGIFRAGVPAILGSEHMPHSLALHAQAIGARLYVLGRDFSSRRHARGHDYRGLRVSLEDLPTPRLAGNAQYGNTATALMALESLGLLPLREAVVLGLGSVRLTGRYQVLPGPVEWVFDVAHNEGSAAVLVQTLIERRSAGRTLFVAGMLKDKDAAAVARILKPAVGAADAVVAVTLPGDRGRAGAELAAVWSPLLGTDVRSSDSVEEGCEVAASLAREGDRVVVFGSFHTVAPALAWRQRRS
jgi:dihydrofolate synthase/folylpolyglutamate synthase